MVTSLYTANIKLNKSDKDYKKYLVVMNDTGVLILEHALYVLSFATTKEFKTQVDVENNNLNHIGDINI